VKNCKTNLQIEASKNTFACKDTGKERVLNCLQATLITGTIMMLTLLLKAAEALS